MEYHATTTRWKWWKVLLRWIPTQAYLSRFDFKTWIYLTETQYFGRTEDDAVSITSWARNVAKSKSNGAFCTALHVIFIKIIRLFFTFKFPIFETQPWSRGFCFMTQNDYDIYKRNMRKAKLVEVAFVFERLQVVCLVNIFQCRSALFLLQSFMSCSLKNQLGLPVWESEIPISYGHKFMGRNIEFEKVWANLHNINWGYWPNLGTLIILFEWVWSILRFVCTP